MFLFYMISVIENEQEKLDKKILNECIFKIAQGDSKAFEELYRRTSSSVYAYALSLLKNKYDAEDVMHDTYINIYNSASTYHSMGKPMAWILTITKNLAIKVILQRQKSVELKEEYDSSFDNIFENTEDNLLLNKCFSILSDEEREIVILHIVSGFKHRESAEYLNLPLSTVLSKYNRALKKLKYSIEQEMNVRE